MIDTSWEHGVGGFLIGIFCFELTNARLTNNCLMCTSYAQIVFILESVELIYVQVKQCMRHHYI